MAYMIDMVYNPGRTVYALLFDSEGDCWSGSAFVTFTGDNDAFDTPLTEHAQRTYYYSADLGVSLDAGTFIEEYWEQAGVSPDRVADTPIGLYEHAWRGYGDFSLLSLPYRRLPSQLKRTYTVQDGDGNPVTGAYVWVTTDTAGAFVIASAVSDAAGKVYSWLDAGTVYYWRYKDGVDFTNPDAVAYAADSYPTGDYTVEIVYDDTGVTLYALLFDQNSLCWNGSAFVAFTGDNDAFDVSLSEDGDRLYDYLATVTPAPDVGEYQEEIWLQVGASPDRAVDTMLGLQTHCWRGDATIDKALTELGTVQGPQDFTYTLQDLEGNPVPAAEIWLCSGLTGTDPRSHGYTDQFGQIVFSLVTGTYCVFSKKAGWMMSEAPDEEMVS